MGRGGGKRRGRPSAIARVSTTDLRRELERRQSSMHDLMRQRDALSAELAELEAAFGSSGGRRPRRMGSTARRGRRGPGRPPGRRGRRPGRPPGRRGRQPRKGSLVEALRKLLAGATMSVSDITEAVQRAGYKTRSPNFRTIVNQALIANRNAFRKVARGQYTAR